jgi:hypothetical protein
MSSFNSMIDGRIEISAAGPTAITVDTNHVERDIIHLRLHSRASERARFLRLLIASVKVALTRAPAC